MAIKKAIIILLICICIPQLILAQSSDKLSVNFNRVSLKEAFSVLEKKTGIKFYYQDYWIENKIVSKKFDEATLKNILNDILEETTLNFIVYNNAVILINNSVVYKDLPLNYFKASNNNYNDNSAIFYNEYDKAIRSKKNLIIIGKQNENSIQTECTITGVIKNDNTGAPIYNMVIALQNSNTYTTTDKNGYFKIIVPSGYNVLEAKLMGYDNVSKELIVYGNGRMDLSISENAEQLDEVLIDAKRDANVKSAVVGLTTIDVVGLKNVPVVLGERDIFKVITTKPGIKKTGEGSSGFNVRGGRTDQNLILLDDAVIYNPSHFLGFFSAINPYTTKSLNIYKASIPSEYGGRLSSVFDIQSKNGNTKTFSGEGALGPVTANLTLETPIIKEKSSLIVGARATYSDWVLNLIDEASLKDSEASFFDGLAKYSHQINDNNNIQGTYYYSKDAFSISNDSILKNSNQLISLKWNHTFNEKNTLDAILVNSQYKYDVNYESNANRNFDFGYKVNETQIKLNAGYIHNKKHKFNYGISSKLYNTNPGKISPIGANSNIQTKSLQKEKGLESALYVANIFKLNKNLTIDTGLRYSYFSALGKATVNVYENDKPRIATSISEVKEFGKNESIKSYGVFEPRISFRYLFNSGFSIKGSYNRTAQYIHLLSSNTTESPTDTWKLSDYNIKPQKANQFALGVYKNLKDNNIELSLEAYYKTMEDILDYRVGGDIIMNENIEQVLLQGKGKAYGIEFLLEKKKGRLNGWFGYSYSRAFTKLDSPFIFDKVNNGDYFPANYDKPHDVSLVGNYKLTHRYSFSANVAYQTGRPITYPIGKYMFAGEEQVVYSDRNKYRIPDYFRVDIGFNIEGNHKIKKLAHSFWNISIYNVLGRANPYSIFFVNENGHVQAYKTSVFAVPIPTITYNFKF
ncbi:TonB-dependent receptor [Mangrovimonas yunxiaonensis]|uniref:TonB-dependent receptor n=1 Tax=Mangrovimonas yunxiaonensis TaxID=1197477 RepID=UPI000E43786A|nr:TonB-dependent receptor [Mangrovimonas yunxiaonensis]GGH41599.1 TonB-dependent receptor [Mangrovimonas yunxiaonensis]